MLWTDADFVDAVDLLTLDPEISDIAAAETMTLDGSVIRRGIEDAAAYVGGKLTRFSSYRHGGDVSANHLAAVLNVGGESSQRQRIALDQIVVTGRNEVYWSPIKTWVAHRCLRIFYRTALNKTQSDRYDSKYELFSTIEANESWPLLKLTGIPIVPRPMPAPAAVQGYDSGTFAASIVNGAGVQVGDYDVRVTYVGSDYVSKAVRGNAESHPSAKKTVTLANGKVLRVDVTNLVPPVDAAPVESNANCVFVPLKAVGWNVYAGLAGGVLYLQNTTPIPIATKIYTLAGDVATSGYTSGSGQYPTSFLTIIDTVQRG
jgi:hypothetical protein